MFGGKCGLPALGRMGQRVSRGKALPNIPSRGRIGTGKIGLTRASILLLRGVRRLALCVVSLGRRVRSLGSRVGG